MPQLPSYPIVRVALPVPLNKCFDYQIPEALAGHRLEAGMRVQVPFGRHQHIGVVESLTDKPDVDIERIKPVTRLLDQAAILDSSLMELCRWASRYYHHPLGEVLAAAIPTALRQGKPAVVEDALVWRLTQDGHQAQPPARAHRQLELLQRLRDSAEGLADEVLVGDDVDWRSFMHKLEQKGWVRRERVAAEKSVSPGSTLTDGPALNRHQQQAVETVLQREQGFQPFLLYGVTGSGKTEVYLRVIQQVLQQGRQVLFLVPEIGLTPQLLQRFQQRFDCPIAVFHSALTDRERLRNWCQARSGEAAIIIGTRSAVFTPMLHPGLIIIDEEHDTSLKQQEGFRYSARDLAIKRASQQQIPILLGSATPSLESMMNVEQGRFTLLELPERAGAAAHPVMRLLDLKNQPLEEGLSPALLQAISHHLQSEGQVLLFLNRRGFAPTLLCHECGWLANCHRCDAHMTLHQRDGRLRCHHCGSERPVERHCPDCGSADLRALGQGTERTEQALQQHFPDINVVRIDRDTTRRKGEMERRLAAAESGEARLLIGTQLLAKGHHFPNVTLVAIIDSDQGLFSADFRGAERMAQLIMQVAGRAGRETRPGEVLIQTWHPQHPLLQLILRQDYRAMVEELLAERQAAGWPPYSYLALLRAEAPGRDAPQGFLRQALSLAETQADPAVMLLGPVPAPMEKRAGRYRAQLLIQSADRAALHRFLSAWLPGLGQMQAARQVRWSIDVDPQEMF